MNMGQLTETIKKLPRSPGIYIFKDAASKLLYVGKALNLRGRVGYYLKTDDLRLKKMVVTAKKIDHIRTNSDIEALILESQYIKKYKPLFNIVLRDDKQYFYVVFTEEKFPKISIAHQSNKIKNLYIGPFTDGFALKTTLRFLRRIFPYCTCKQPHSNFCLNYHIGKCLGYCCLKNPPQKSNNQIQYRKNILAVKEMLNGKKVFLIRKLEKEMKKFAVNENLEKAVDLKNKIYNLKRTFENARIIKSELLDEKILGETAKILRLSKLPKRIEGYDISSIQGLSSTGSMVVFEDGISNKNGYRKFKIRSKNSPDDTAMLKEILNRRFKHPEWQFPDLILVDGGRGQLNTAAREIENSNLKISIIALAKNKKHSSSHVFTQNIKDPMSLKNLPARVRNLILRINSEAHRFAISYYRVLHRKKLKPIVSRQNIV